MIAAVGMSDIVMAIVIGAIPVLITGMILGYCRWYYTDERDRQREEKAAFEQRIRDIRGF